VVAPARQTGYRLLGPRFDYLLHTRPAEWPIVAAHCAVGYLLAVGLDGAGHGDRLGPAALGVILWVVFLNGGTLALNSAYDRDDGDIAYLHQPPPPPRHLAFFGTTLMVFGLAASFLLPLGYRLAYGLCLGLSVLYSVPPLRLKSVPGVDWAINMLGFGTLTPYAGWATTGLPVGPEGRFILAGFCLLFAALYPLTQIYQYEEDARRGDRTLAGTLGPRLSLLIATGCAALAFGFYGTAALADSWTSGRGWRWVTLGIAALAWLGVLIPWTLRSRAMAQREHQQGMYRALIAWAITDAVIVVNWGT
jgi:lycopene elongase/hydratase (dihydrobisanhydrobacterioruberin-forming)